MFPADSSDRHDDLGEALSPELFQQIKGLQIRARRLVTEAMAGEYESAFKGRGMEFEEVREYQPGDDIRHIDWNVTARSGVPHVKQFREERELTVMLMVDVSSSGMFGSDRKLNREVAAEVAAVLAYTAIHSNDRVGLIVFSDTVERYIPPKKGRAHVWRVIREIIGFRPRRKGTDIEAALDFLNRVSRRAAVVFVLSDFQDSGFEHRLRLAARKHDVTAVHVVDRRETTLPAIGVLELEDAETGEILMVDTYDRSTVEAFAGLAGKRREELAELFRSAGAGALEIHTDEPYIDDLIRYFHAREKRR